MAERGAVEEVLFVKEDALFLRNGARVSDDNAQLDQLSVSLRLHK